MLTIPWTSWAGNFLSRLQACIWFLGDCGYPLSRYTCRATRVAADFLDFIAFCRCSSGVAPHPLKILVSHLPPPPPPFPGGVAPKFGSEKVSRYSEVSQVQLRVLCYTVQLSLKSRLESRVQSCETALMKDVQAAKQGLLNVFGGFLGRFSKPCHIQNTTVILIHYGGGKTIWQ